MTNPRQIERQAISRVLREGFLGPAFDDTTYCPVSIPGITFDPAADADCAPFTSQQVLTDVGYVQLSSRELDSFDAGVTSGLADVSGSERMVKTVNTITRWRFTLYVPTARDFAEERLELYEERVRELFFGLALAEPGPPQVRLRQLAHYAPRLVGDSDDGDWRRRDFDIPIRRQDRQPHAIVA